MAYPLFLKHKKGLRLALAIFNGFFSFVYLLGLIAAILFMTVDKVSDILPREVSSAFLIVSFCFMAVSMLGLYGALSSRRAILWINGLLSLFIVIIFLTVGVFLIFKRSDLKGYASGIWDDFSDNSKIQIQSWGKCCGFDSYSDRKIQPCKPYDPALGCWSAMEEWFAKSTLYLLIVIFSLATLQLIACFLVLALLKLIPKSIDIARNRRRTFAVSSNNNNPTPSLYSVSSASVPAPLSKRMDHLSVIPDERRGSNQSGKSMSSFGTVSPLEESPP